MKKLFCFLLLIFFTFFAQAQDSTSLCGTADMDTTEFKQLPWFDNNDLLETFLDSIGYDNAGARLITPEQVRYHVPIKFWVYRSSAGIGGLVANGLLYSPTLVGKIVY